MVEDIKNDQFNNLVKKLKSLYFLEDTIEKKYTFELNNKIYKSILAYNVSKIRKLSADLIILKGSDVNIKELFEYSEFTCIIILNDKNNYKIFMRKGLDDFVKINSWPSVYKLFWINTKEFFLYIFKGIFKGIELIIIQVLIAILRIIFPPLSKKLWEYYKDPYKRVIRKKDIDKVPK